MAGNLRIFSLNTGMSENLAGLVNFIKNYNLDIIFLQEVRLTNDQILTKVGGLGYSVEVNINEEDSSKPGTAIVWKSSLQIINFGVLVQCRCQFAFLGNHILVNVYAHSGSGKNMKGTYFLLKICSILWVHIPIFHSSVVEISTQSCLYLMWRMARVFLKSSVASFQI